MGDKVNWTLEEIEGHDIDNLQTLLSKEPKDYSFAKVDEAVVFSGQVLNRALMKHGINLEAVMHISKDHEEFDDVSGPLDAIMTEKHVRVETRMNYTGLDRWRCGIYIYKDNEIADFIGAPVRRDGAFSVSGSMFVITTTVSM